MAREWKKINNHMFFGVAAGLAYMLGIKTWIVRVIWTLLVLFSGIGIIPYLILAIFIPKWDKDPVDYSQICE